MEMLNRAKTKTKNKTKRRSKNERLSLKNMENKTIHDKNEKLLSALSPQDAMKLKSLLSDKAATQKLMQSEQVQKLIKKLSEGK